MIETIYIARHGLYHFVCLNLRRITQLCRKDRIPSKLDHKQLVGHNNTSDILDVTDSGVRSVRESLTGLPKDPPLTVFGIVSSHPLSNARVDQQLDRTESSTRACKLLSLVRRRSTTDSDFLFSL